MKVSRATLKHPMFQKQEATNPSEMWPSDPLDVRRVNAEHFLWDYAPYVPSVPIRKVHHKFYDFISRAEADDWNLAGTGAADYGANLTYVEGSWGTVFLSSPGNSDYATAIPYLVFDMRYQEDFWYEIKVRVAGNTNCNAFVGLTNLDYDAVADDWVLPHSNVYNPSGRDNCLGFQITQSSATQVAVAASSLNDDAGISDTQSLGVRDTSTWFTLGFHVKNNIPGSIYAETYLDGSYVGISTVSWQDDNPVKLYDGQTNSVLVPIFSLVGLDPLEESKIEIDWLRMMMSDPFDDP